uniref:CUB domain-containing protein n=1 Tax=Sus scrofa TaxID=9823 RepID=A0A8D1YH74_PIG
MWINQRIFPAKGIARATAWPGNQIQFVGGSSLEREGFNATYTLVDMPCGGTYNATWTSQSIWSPSSSDPDVPLTTCTWVIEAPLHQQVEITVWTFQLHSQDCDQNYLEFRDPPERNGNPGIRFCGRNASAVPTFYSSLSERALNTGTPPPRGISSFLQGCSREYQKAFGRLRSPGWPAGYASNVDCAVVLRAPQNHTISLFFHAFGLEDSGGCTRDFLEVRNGSESTSPLLGKYCGTLLPNPIFSQSRDLYLRFKSDSATSGRGYEIIWTSSPSGCGGTLYGDSGLVTSPGYPGTYPNHTHCEWVIIAPGGRPVTVSFSFINIDDPGECVQNYLMLYDGPDANSPSSGPYCGAVIIVRVTKLDCAWHRLCICLALQTSGPNSPYRIRISEEGSMACCWLKALYVVSAHRPGLAIHVISA